MITPGISKVTSQASVVFQGPLDVNVMFQNQGPAMLLIGLNEELGMNGIELLPLRSIVAPAGIGSVWAMVPTAKAGTRYNLFHSPVETPADVWI